MVLILLLAPDAKALDVRAKIFATAAKTVSKRGFAAIAKLLFCVNHEDPESIPTRSLLL